MSTQSQERAANSLIAITPEENVSDAVVRPETQHQFEVDADIALSRQHSLGVDLDFETRRTENSRVGGFTLPERGSDEERGEWALQVSERRLGNDSANDFRVRVSRQTSQEIPRTTGVAINVADAFNRGGSTSSDLDRDARIQLENRLRWQRGEWSYQAGLEGRYDSNYSLSENNYNGTFNFAGLHDYCRATGFFGVNCAPTRQIVEAALARGTVPVYLDARGDAVEITGLPTTYSVTSGDGELDIGELSLETFFQADRGFGEHASLRLGLRYEATNHSQDYLRANPLANFQYRWFEDTVLGVGASLSFRDFGDYERLIRNDGASHQKRLSISSPSFPDPFLNGVSTIDERRTTLTVLDPAYRAPYSFNPQLNLTQPTTRFNAGQPVVQHELRLSATADPQHQCPLSRDPAAGRDHESTAGETAATRRPDAAVLSQHREHQPDRIDRAIGDPPRPDSLSAPKLHRRPRGPALWQRELQLSLGGERQRLPQSVHSRMGAVEPGTQPRIADPRPTAARAVRGASPPEGAGAGHLPGHESQSQCPHGTPAARTASGAAAI